MAGDEKKKRQKCFASSQKKLFGGSINDLYSNVSHVVPRKTKELLYLCNNIKRGNKDTQSAHWAQYLIDLLPCHFTPIRSIIPRTQPFQNLVLKNQGHCHGWAQVSMSHRPSSQSMPSFYLHFNRSSHSWDVATRVWPLKHERLKHLNTIDRLDHYSASNSKYTGGECTHHTPSSTTHPHPIPHPHPTDFSAKFWNWGSRSINP